MAVHPPPFAVRCLKADGPRIVWLIERADQSPRILKSWPLNPWRLLKYLFGISAPQRLVRGNRILHRLGIAVPELISAPRIVADRWHLRVDTELHFVPGRSGSELLQHAIDTNSLESPLMMNAAGAIGDIIASLVRNHVFHRDLTIGNFVLDDSARVWVVDTDGVRRMRNRIRETERMLGRVAAHRIPATLVFPARLARRLLIRAISPLSRQDRRALLRDLRAQDWVQALVPSESHGNRRK